MLNRFSTVHLIWISILLAKYSIFLINDPNENVEKSKERTCWEGTRNYFGVKL